MTTHREIITSLGGIRGLARRLGHKNHTTVQGWWDRDNIPEQRLPEVLSVAARAAAAVLPTPAKSEAAAA